MLCLFVRLRMSVVLGVDVAGEVVERGAGVTRFTVGDRVFAYTGLSRPGGYGELVALPPSPTAGRLELRRRTERRGDEHQMKVLDSER
jgi:NADPH:quinone reductase-like Zn-dependent oxidoreductase